jgi:hypothetical protein
MKICENACFSPNAYNARGIFFGYSCRHYAIEKKYKKVYKSFHNYFWKIWLKFYRNLLRVKLVYHIGQNG